MKPLALVWIAAMAGVVGCGEQPNSTRIPVSAAQIIRECVESSGDKLDKALADGDVAATAREIVQVLDDYEDSDQMKQFTDFHRGMEELEAMAAKDAGSDALKTKIEELRTLVERLLKTNDEAVQ